MGARVLASVFCACFLLAQGRGTDGATGKYLVDPLRDEDNNVPGEGSVHSAVPTHNNPEVSATNYQPYNVKLYAVSAENARSDNPYNVYGYGDAASYEGGPKYNEYASIEAAAEGYNQNFDTTGYNHYKTATSFNLEGPRQLETITTHSFQKEVEPYDVTGFQRAHDHKEEEEHAEVHYHQHKHMHKHSHKQEHVHKHQQEHKHDHGHKHEHQAKHEHKHEAKHKHGHHAEHKHVHKGEHDHRHHQEHKHAHHAGHKHEHKHLQEHKHDHHHGHKHEHKGEHKHSHHADHKHEHKHGHKHENEHKHKHEHKEDHKHKHGHKDEHKHKHHSSHHHKHSYQKH